ncbi:MAG TPA: amidohydrolase family protein [Mycobacteriales bacterium]|nr:amidohydrolase family protein [Mycobacteriales bacterium]
MTAILWRADRVVTAEDHDADAFVTDGGRFVWVGRHGDADGSVAKQIDLRGTVVSPAFVDGHVHSTATGIALDGLDLHDATSVTDLLDRVAAFARSHPGVTIRGTGWDESTWPDRRAPTATELDAAGGGAVVYLARADVHSAVVSSALLARCEFGDAEGVIGDGLLRLDAHHVARRIVNSELSASETERAQRRALAEAARLGIGLIHEMAGPEIAGLADLESLLALRDAERTVDVAAYWGALGDVSTPTRLGLVGAGGDLFCDGSIGSHTAALHTPYADADTTGTLRFDVAELAAHIVATVRAGLQSGFHVIGDAAVDLVLDAYERALGQLDGAGQEALRRGRHRLEHVEMAGAEAVARMTSLGLTASVQPAFDATWGGPDLMYADRLGPDRGVSLNPYAALHRAGVLLALGSDSPVTAIDPWGAVRSAVNHRTPESAIAPATAFRAATTNGHRAVRVDDAGEIRAGQLASFACWDASSADPALWDAIVDESAHGMPGDTPACVRTVVRGRTAHDMVTVPSWT